MARKELEESSKTNLENTNCNYDGETNLGYNKWNLLTERISKPQKYPEPQNEGFWWHLGGLK